MVYVEKESHSFYDMFHMEIDRLKQFCVIVETGSMTKAAKLMHITHSGLSKSMQILPSELNTVLLQPAGRGITLTDAGIKVYHRAKIFLQQQEQFLQFDNPSQESHDG